MDRNTIRGFAERVRKNLTFMIAARERCEDVHIVTELTTALLGLIVFPYEYFRDRTLIDFKKYRLDDLAADGWPVWEFHRGSSGNLHNHLRHVRNALSHRWVHFSSDERALEQIEVKFWDRPYWDKEKQPEPPPINWTAEINGATLLDFVLRLSRLIDEETRVQLDHPSTQTG